MYKIAFLISILLLGCTEKKMGTRPQDRLSEYISLSFNVKDDSGFRDLLGYLTGDAKARLGSWSEDQFYEVFVNSKRKFERLILKSVKKISETEVNITYELHFSEMRKGKTVNIKNRKLCRMVFENKKWLIKEVMNIKELVEFENSLTVP